MPSPMRWLWWLQRPAARKLHLDLRQAGFCRDSMPLAVARQRAIGSLSHSSSPPGPRADTVVPHTHHPTRFRPAAPPSPTSSAILQRLPSRRPLTTTPRRHYDPHSHHRLQTARPLFTSDQLKRRLWAPSTRAVVVLAFLGGLAFYFSNLETVPVSGRRRFNCFGEESVRAASEMSYKMVMHQIESQGGRFLPESDWRVRMVKRVMRRLIPVSGMDDVEWEVRVIDDPHTANAFVLPGGKVFVHSGILQFTRNDDGLAAVLGHEIAHNLAEHVAERMSTSIGTGLLFYSLLFLSIAVPGGIFAAQFLGRALLQTLFEGPMSRLQESEADYIGLIMMAEACYDPREAAKFWSRMDARAEAQPPEWLSTHPSNQSRVEKIQQWMPKAMDKRAESDCQGTQGFAELFRRALQRGEIIVV